MMKKNMPLILAEILVMGGIVVAFIAPLLVPAEESSEVEEQTIQVAVNDKQMERKKSTNFREQS